MRTYAETCKDPNATPLERETAMLQEWNETLKLRDAETTEITATLRERISGLGTVIQSQIDEIVTLKKALVQLHATAVCAAEHGLAQSQEMLAQWEKLHGDLLK